MKHMYGIITGKGELMEVGEKDYIREVYSDIISNIPDNSGVSYPKCHIEHGVKNILNAMRTTQDYESAKRLIEMHK